MPTPSDYATKMMAALRASEPDLDTSTGTPLRKILDAVAEQLAEASADQHLLTYQYDIDSKSGGDLDDFVALFGFARIPAQRAQGVVTFSRTNDATAQQTSVVIPPNSQVVAATSPLVYVQTTTAAVMNPGQFTADAPVQAVVAGPAGNVAAGLLSNMVGTIGTLSSVTNTNPMSGGTAQETDAALRTRFKATVFRSLAGTTAMYQATALEIPQDPALPQTRAVSQVNVLGSSKRWREQLQMVGGSATSTITGAAYIFADNTFAGTDIDAGSILSPGVNYTFTPSNPTNRGNASAVLTALAGMPDGLYDLDFEYVPQASRNDPGNTRFGFGGINNRIDVWTNGLVTQTAVQTVVFTNASLFTAGINDPYYNQRFLRASDTAPFPAVGDIFIPLAYGPITSLPNTLSVAGVTYNEGIDYFICHQNDCNGWGPTSLFGIAWISTHRPAVGSVFSVSYTYNQVPTLVQDAINQWRLVGTDAKAHAGKPVYLQLNLAMVYDRRYDPTSVNTAIDTAMSTMMANLGFESLLQVSDILQTVHNVPGVDNVRFLTSTDNATSYAISRMSAYNVNSQISLFAANGRAMDVQFPDDQYPVYYGSAITVKAANTFGTG